MIIAIDTETTGLSPARGDRVIEWAAVKIDGGSALMIQLLPYVVNREGA